MKKWLVAVALIILCGIPFFHSYNLRDRPLGEDEIYWTGQAYFYHLAFERWDWSHPDWGLLPARENPVLGKYIIGLGLRLNGLSVTNLDWLGIFYIIAKDRPNAWGNARDQVERQAVLDRMEPKAREVALSQGKFAFPIEYAVTARLVMLIFGMLAVMLVFALTSFYARPVTAFIVAALFALHPAVVSAYTEVGVDILAMAFSLLAVVHFVLIERGVWRRCARPRWCQALICASGALCFAFAIGSKMNAVVVGFLGAALCSWFVLSFLRNRSADSKESGAVLLILLLGALIIFSATNPANYPNPVAGIRSLYAAQQRSLEVQKGIPTLRHPLRSGGERLCALAELTAFHPAVFGLIVGAFLYQVLARRPAGNSPSVIALWWLIAVVAVAAWLPFARPRYVLPLVAPCVILLGCTGERMLHTAASRMARRRQIP